MIEINLLPSGAARRVPAARALRAPSGPKLGADPRIAALGAAAVLLLLLGGYLYWQSGGRVTELEAQVRAAEADSVRLQRTLGMLSTLRARQDTVEQKIAVIRAVDGRRYVWPHLMDEVSRAVPQYTWLTKVAATEEDVGAAPAPLAAGASSADSAKADSIAAAAEEMALQGPGFTIEGNAATTQALTRLMKNLEASPMIRDVTLVTSEQTEVEGGSAFQKFTLEARYETPDSSLIETVPVLTAP